MKGTFFAKPLEWNVDVQGESWRQGDMVKGTVTLRNHSGDAVALDQVAVIFAQGNIKKVHARDPKAFQESSQLALSKTSLGANETLTLPFSFQLPTNCAVTDKRTSYYIAYGVGGREANLQLKVEPRLLFTEVSKLMETFQRFKFKEITAGKTGVEYKFLPPASRDWAHVESLLLTLSLEGEALHLDFCFNTKTIDKESVTTAIAKDKREFERVLNPREYSLGPDMVNQDGIMRALDGVLAEVKSKGL